MVFYSFFLFSEDDIGKLQKNFDTKILEHLISNISITYTIIILTWIRYSS